MTDLSVHQIVQEPNAVYIEWCVRSKGNPSSGFIQLDMGYLLTPECPTLHLASTAPWHLKEQEGTGFHYCLKCPLDTVTIRTVMSCGEAGDLLEDTEALLLHFEDKSRESEAYLQRLKASMPGKVPPHLADTALPMRQAMYVSVLNCALSAYKKVDTFAGFFAGVHYQTPARTYFRDSYYTRLPLIKETPDWVKAQIRTLSFGISEDGKCPSGVKADYSPFWENHLDSPAYFILLVDAYLHTTNDTRILDMETGEHASVLELMQRIIEGMLNQTNESGMLYRELYNRHDWADNVYRCGYVTYIEALFYEALRVTAHWMEQYGIDGTRYREAAEKVKTAVNQYLWDEKKGYYINYIHEDYREDHLSLDTVLVLKFGIASPERALRTLKNMESILESKNNASQLFGDWGVLCVYPFYQYKEHLVEKSSNDYVYHNGSDWPYLSALYAGVKKQYGLSYEYPLAILPILPPSQPRVLPPDLVAKLPQPVPP